MLHSTLGSQLSAYRPSSSNAARDAWDFLVHPQPTRADVARGQAPAPTASDQREYTTDELKEYKKAKYQQANPYVRLVTCVKNWNWSKYGNSGLEKANAAYERVYKAYMEHVRRNAQRLVGEAIDGLPDGDPLKRALEDDGAAKLKLHLKYVFLPDDSIVEPPLGMLLVDHGDHGRKWTLSLNNLTIERVPHDYGDLDTKHAMHAHFVAKPFEGTKLEGTPIAADALLVCSEPERLAKAGRGRVVTATDLGREIASHVAAEYKKEMENNRAATAQEREIDEKAKARNAAFLDGRYPLVKTLDAALNHNSNGVRENVFHEATTLAKIGTGIAVGATENGIEAVHFGLRYMY